MHAFYRDTPTGGLLETTVRYKPTENEDYPISDVARYDPHGRGERSLVGREPHHGHQGRTAVGHDVSHA